MTGTLDAIISSLPATSRGVFLASAEEEAHSTAAKRAAGAQHIVALDGDDSPLERIEEACDINMRQQGLEVAVLPGQ